MSNIGSRQVLIQSEPLVVRSQSVPFRPAPGAPAHSRDVDLLESRIDIRVATTVSGASGADADSASRRDVV